MRKLFLSIALIGLVFLTLGAPAGAWPKTDLRVTLCHATTSDTNPYVKVTVAVEAVVKHGQTVVSFEGGHGDHLGPVWVLGLKAQHIKWGDIIPAFTVTTGQLSIDYPGLNVPEGQSWLDNDCVHPPDPTTTTTETPTSAVPTTTTVAPTTTTVAPSTTTTTVAPSTTTTEVVTTTLPPETTTSAPTTTTGVPTSTSPPTSVVVRPTSTTTSPPNGAVTVPPAPSTSSVAVGTPERAVAQPPVSLPRTGSDGRLLLYGLFLIACGTAGIVLNNRHLNKR